MRLLIIVLLMPLLGISQTFEKVISESFFQRPIDLIEIPEGYLLLTSEGISDEEDNESKIYILDSHGKILKQKLFDNYYSDKLSNAILLNDTTFLVVGNINKSETDSMKIIFRLINNKLDILQEEIIETIIFKTVSTGFLASQSELVIFKNSIVYALGYHAMGDKKMRGLYLVKMSKLLSNIEVKSYKQLPLPDLSLPECLLPYQNADTLLLFFPAKIYKFDSNLNIVDSLPEDFTRFNNENGVYGIHRPLSAVWLSDKLILGGNDNIFSYNSNLTKDTFIHFEFPDQDLYAAYYKCMSVNQNYAFLSFAFNLDSLWHGLENTLRIVKVDNNLNIYWDKFYKENDGYFYSAFNTLATKDGGCIIATTRNNLNTQGKQVDIYLLKVDSLGNYDTTTTVLSNSINNIKVYPNPGGNYITIEMVDDLYNSELVVYNKIGVVVLKELIKSPIETYNTTNLTNGLYIYEIRRLGKNIERGKWIKSSR
jgi:hypothetical protein